MRHLLLQCGCHPGYTLTMHHTPDTLNSKPAAATRLLPRLLSLDPRNRIGATECLSRHPYLNDFHHDNGHTAAQGGGDAGAGDGAAAGSSGSGQVAALQAQDIHKYTMKDITHEQRVTAAKKEENIKAKTDASAFAKEAKRKQEEGEIKKEREWFIKRNA